MMRFRPSHCRLFFFSKTSVVVKLFLRFKDNKFLKIKLLCLTSLHLDFEFATYSLHIFQYKNKMKSTKIHLEV